MIRWRKNASIGSVVRKPVGYLRRTRRVNFLGDSKSRKRPVFLRADWNHLLFANYKVHPDLLKSLVPRGTILDTWKGMTFLSLVAFRFNKSRILGSSVLRWRNFEEVNLRFYVKNGEKTHGKKGVVFIKEFVPSSLVAIVARLLYGENYEKTTLSSEVKSSPPASRSVTYEIKHSERVNTFSGVYTAMGVPPDPNSLESFITEHYWGFSLKNECKTVEYEVEHPRWPVSEIDNYVINIDYGKLYGKSYEFLSSAKPHSVFYCEGSEVLVRFGTKLYHPQL